MSVSGQPLILYGAHISTCTKRVETVLRYHNLKYEFQHVDYTVLEHKGPAFLKLQPFGQVPVIIHGDFVVYESRAIARYIDRIASPTSGKQLLPLDDLQKTALIEQWLSVDHDNLQPALKDVVAEKYHWYCPTENAEVLKAAQTKLLAFFDVFEVHFAKNKYFVGDNITLADISPLPYLEMYYLLGEEYAESIDSRPNFSNWWKRMRALAAWQETLAAAATATAN